MKIEFDTKRVKEIGKEFTSYLPDVLIFLLLIYLWKNTEVLLQTYIDKTSAVPAGDYLSAFVFALFGVALAHVVVKILMLISWRPYNKTLEKEMEERFEQLTPWGKIQASLFVYLLYFISFIILAASMV